MAVMGCSTDADCAASKSTTPMKKQCCSDVKANANNMCSGLKNLDAVPRYYCDLQCLFKPQKSITTTFFKLKKYSSFHFLLSLGFLINPHPLQPIL